MDAPVSSSGFDSVGEKVTVRSGAVTGVKHQKTKDFNVLYYTTLIWRKSFPAGTSPNFHEGSFIDLFSQQRLRESILDFNTQ
jgi:hypothetical protein